MNTPNLDPLIQQYRQAAAAQEELVQRLRGAGQGTAEERNQLILDAARNTRAAEEAISRALPPGQTLRDVLGSSGAVPAGAPSGGAGGAVTVPPTGGTSRYLQRVLDAHRLGNLGIQVQDNILNQYDRYTYKFGLYLVNDQDSEDPQIGTKIFNNQVRKFTVAESGVTVGFNIVDVEITDHVSSSFRNRNNVTSDINITITEPYGLTLVDRMFLASKQLGIMNWRMAPMLLTLEMRAINADGSMSREAALIRKAYKLIVSDMNSQLTEVGSTYKIQAAVSNAMGFRDQFYMLPMNLVIKLGANRAPTELRRESTSPARTATGSSGSTPTAPPTATIISTTLDGSVGQFFQELGSAMTAFYREARARGASVQSAPFLIYEFQVAPDLANQRLLFVTTLSNNTRRRGFSVGGQNNQEVHVNRAGISELVDDIMSNLADVSFLVPNNQAGTVRVPRVECRVEHVGWDGVLNDYIRKFTFYISVMETARPVPNPETGYNFQEGPNASIRQADRLRALAQRKSVQKVYPYYYTGMNTEVINLDITFNSLHVIPLPLHNGQTVTPSDGQSLQTRLTELVRTRTELEAQRAAQQRILDTAQAQIDALRQVTSAESLTNLDQFPELRAAIEQDIDRISAQPGRLGISGGQNAVRQAAQNRIALLSSERTVLPTSIGSLNTQIDQFTSDIEALRNNNVFLFPQSGITISGVNRQVTPQIQALIDQSTATQTRNNSLRSERRFIEDMNINSQVNEMGRLTYIASPQDIVNNLARPPDSSDANITPTRSTYSTILAQMYDRVGLQLTEIEMEIRGDPYWLGETNLERLEQLRSLSTPPPPGETRQVITSSTFASTQSGTYANYHGQDAGFLLLFRAGNQPSEQTGYMMFEQGNRENQSVFFNGLYLAIEVTHVFSMGKFTQKIRAQRDNLIDLSRVGGAASQSATNAPQAGATGAATPVAPTAPPSRPAAASPQPTTTPPAPAPTSEVSREQAARAGVVSPGGTSPPLPPGQVSPDAPTAPPMQPQDPPLPPGADLAASFPF